MHRPHQSKAQEALAHLRDNWTDDKAVAAYADALEADGKKERAAYIRAALEMKELSDDAQTRINGSHGWTREQVRKYDGNGEEHTAERLSPEFFAQRGLAMGLREAQDEHLTTITPVGLGDPRLFGLSSGIHFDRGLPSNVQIREYSDFKRLEAQIFDGKNEISSLNFDHAHMTREQWQEILHHDGMERIAELKFHFSGVTNVRSGEHSGDLLADLIASSPTLTGLRSLDISLLGLPSQDGSIHYKLTELLESPNLANLERLDLGGNDLQNRGDDGVSGDVKILVDKMPRLHDISLTNTGFNDKDAKYLAASPNSEKFTFISMGGDGIGLDATRALGGSPHLQRLEGIFIPGSESVEAAFANAVQAARVGNPDHMKDFVHINRRDVDDIAPATGVVPDALNPKRGTRLEGQHNANSV